MKVRKTGWVVWDKRNQCIKTRSNMFVFYRKTSAWLSADKERKDSPYKVVKVSIQIEKKKR